MNFIILVSMFFLHIVDDYYLQGLLAKLKQKEWWKINAPSPLYKHDYLIALVEHAFSWSFMIHIPIMVAQHNILISTFLLDLIVHAIVDNEKANKHSINLITDQCIHFLQIILTYLFYIVM